MEPAAEQPGDSPTRQPPKGSSRAAMEPAAEQPGDCQRVMPGSGATSPPQWSRLLNSRVTAGTSLTFYGTEGRNGAGC